MRVSFLSRPLCVVLWLSVGISAAADARAQTTGAVTTIATLDANTTGSGTTQALTIGRDGSLYGTTTGGANYSGTIFRVIPGGTATLLHTFDSATDGKSPRCSLLLASDGNFYGTTLHGGSPGSSNDISNSYGGGTVFRMTPDGVFTVLHVFPDDGRQGKQPDGGLVQGNDGALYGTTQLGGAATGDGDDGTLFRITLDGTFTILHVFDYSQTGTGALGPHWPLTQGSDGNFYGVAAGGDSDDGVIYKLTPDGTVTYLHSFSGADGEDPVGSLVEGSPGVFYGITQVGGSAGLGTFFRVTGGGELTTIHEFSNFNESVSPQGGLTKGADGNFYLPTTYGGSINSGAGYGNILQCTPTGVVTNLYKFGYVGGHSPKSTLVLAGDGSFYGATAVGSTVYRLVVTPHPPFFNGETDLANGVEYLAFPNGEVFGYYAFLSDPHYVYHFDLGYEYVFDAADSKSGVYLYDFKSGDFFYTSPTFPFPYLYDFNLQAFLYYYPDPNNPGRYNTNGVRYCYNFSTRQIITR